MSTSPASVIFVLLVCLSFLFQVWAQLLPLGKAQDQNCYLHDYTLVNVTDGGNETRVEHTCTDTTNFFPDEKRYEIADASTTIKTISYNNTFADVTIAVNGEDFNVRFIICGCNLPSGSEDKDAYFFTNPTSIFVDDGPSVAFILELALNYSPIAYIDSIDNKYDADLRKRHETNKTEEILSDSGDYDWKILPEKVSVAVLSSDSFERQKDAASANFSGYLLPMAAQEEKEPLARAEWVKVFGLLFYRPSFAIQVFDDIKKDYNDFTEKAGGASRVPTVVFNSPSKEDGGFNWTQPGSEDYEGRFILDAYASHRYLPTSTTPTISDLSTISNDFMSADFFLNARSVPVSSNLSEFFESFGSEDAVKALKRFASIRCGKLWSQDNRLTGEANDYFESGVVKPHIVLKDFVSILHPELDFVKEHEQVYMRRIGREDGKFEDIEECPYVEFEQNSTRGNAYVDKTFTVSDLDIFEVQDAIEPDVLPRLDDAGIPRTSVQFWFTERAEANPTETKLTVRRNLSLADADEFDKDADAMVAVLESGLNVSVEETSSNVLPEEPEDGGSNGGSNGLSGGAIAGIVIAVLLVLVVGYACLRWRRNRSRTHDALGGEELEGEGELGEGSYGGGDFQAGVL